MPRSEHDVSTAASRLAGLVRGVGDDQLGAETPCHSWTVADLVRHILGFSAEFAAAAQKRSAESVTVELMGGWRELAARRLSELALAWRAPDAQVGEAEAGGVRLPAAQLAVVALDELVLHGWDLARATNQSFEVAQADAEVCLTFAQLMAEPDQAQSREGLYGPVVQVGPDAPALYRLLGASGRSPSWRSSAGAGSAPGATLVLVPGAWMGGWIWHDTVAALRSAGCSATTLTMDGLQPGLSREARAAVDLAQHVDQLVRFIENKDLHDVVLVAHSYSGLVVGQVADRLPNRVRRSIHLGAFLPRDGRSLVDDWGRNESERTDEREQIGKDGQLWAPPTAPALETVSDLDDAQRVWLSGEFVEHPGRTVLDRVTLTEPVTAQPVTFVAMAEPGQDPLNDLPPELIAGLPGRWRLRTLTSGHWPMLSVPEPLQSLLLEESRT